MTARDLLFFALGWCCLTLVALLIEGFKSWCQRKRPIYPVLNQTHDAGHNLFN